MRRTAYKDEEARGEIQLSDPATRKLRLSEPRPLKDLINADVTSYDHPANL